MEQRKLRIRQRDEKLQLMDSRILENVGGSRDLSRMRPALRRWHNIRTLWRCGALMHAFVSTAEAAALARKQYEMELKDARRAKLRFEQEQQEKIMAAEQAAQEALEAEEARQRYTVEQAEAEAAEVDLKASEVKLASAEKEGLSIAAVARLKRCA